MNARPQWSQMGTCVVPIGPHSIMNGVFLKAGRARAPGAVISFWDQLGAFFRETGGVEAWSREVTRHNLHVLGLDTTESIPLRTYLVAARRSDALTKEAAFQRLESKVTECQSI